MVNRANAVGLLITKAFINVVVQQWIALAVIAVAAVTITVTAAAVVEFAPD